MKEALKEKALEMVPRRAGEVMVDFRELHRVLSSHSLSEADIKFIAKEIIARRAKFRLKEKVYEKWE